MSQSALANSVIKSETPSSPDQLWPVITQEAKEMQKREPVLALFITGAVTGRADFAAGLGHILAEELAGNYVDAPQWRSVIAECHRADSRIVASAARDLVAIMERDPAARAVVEPFLFFKGFHSLQAYRIAHWLWKSRREALALSLQARVSRRFNVDIHPAAEIGFGVMLDHATGVVIGETAVVEDNVSMLHDVTLGGTGNEIGNRHPKIRAGAMLGAGVKVLGNIEIGKCARVAAGSLVLESVPARATVAGVPAHIIKVDPANEPAHDMHQLLSGRLQIRTFTGEPPPGSPDE
jgi:serine O-acetyltransferase